MASALKKFKFLEQQTGDQPPPSPVVKQQRKKLPDLYQHIASRFENSDEAKRKRALEQRRSKEEIKKFKEEEEQRKKEERLRIQREKEEEERRKRDEEERRRQEEENKRLAMEAEKQRIELEKQKREEEERLRYSLTAKSMYEQALQKGAGKSNSADKVVTLRKGTISDIRNKFTKKNDDNAPGSKKVPKKHIINDRCEKSKSDTVIVKKEDETKKDSTKVNPDHSKLETNSINIEKEAVVESKDNKSNMSGNSNDDDPSKVKSKRQSFITDFAALEKTYKMLGIFKEPLVIEDDEQPKKKRHASEGKTKKKTKSKTNIPVKSKSQKEEPKTTAKVKLDAVDKGLSEEKKNYFQQKINESRNSKAENSIIGPKLRKKTDLVAAFEDKAKENAKRNSLVKEDIKVDAHMFSNFINKFESEDQRAQAKVKIAQLTAQQRKFEERKKVLQEELQRRKQEEEEMEKAIQKQIEEQEMQRRKKEEEEKVKEEKVKLEADNSSSKENQAVKKTKKLKKKKKKEESPLTEELPQLKLGFVDFTDNKNKFENLRKNSEPSPEVKTVKVNKLQINSFLQGASQDDRSDVKEPQIKVNKLTKNAFMKQLEMQAEDTKIPRVKRKAPDPPKKNQPEIKFASKKNSVEKKDEQATEPVMLKPKVRGSKSIENPIQNKKDRKHSSTLSLFFDSTKEFFKNSREKLFKLSKETLQEIDQIQEDAKPSTSEMQNYLLSRVLFDKAEMQKTVKKEKQLTKEEEFDMYLDKDYRERIEQYCALVDDKKTKKKKSKSKKKEEKLPEIKLVEVKSIQEKLINQIEKPADKKINIEEIESLGKNRVKEVASLLISEVDSPMKNENHNKKPQRMNSSIIDKIRLLETAEEERIKREKENELRIKMLLEKELEREAQRKQDDRNEQENFTESTEEKEMKDDIWLRLEEEIDNLEEEQRELETTEQMLIEEEKARDEKNVENNQAPGSDDNIMEMKVELKERREHAEVRKQVLKRFQHVFDKDLSEENKKEVKVGSIHDKIENFLLNSDKDKDDKKKFEDTVLSGVSDIMSKVKDKFETSTEEQSITYRPELKRKLNTAAMKFEHLTTEAAPEVQIPKQEKEWAWKNKTALELELENAPRKSKNNDKKKNEKRKGFQDIKYDEILGDINAVKERIRERNLMKENEDKMIEMNRFMDEMRQSMKKIEQEELKEKIPEATKLKPKPKKLKQPSAKKASPKVRRKETSELVKNIKNELIHEKHTDSSELHYRELEDFSVSVNSLKKKIVDNDSREFQHNVRTDKPSPKSTTGIVNRMAEMLSQEEEKIEQGHLKKAPKLLLRNTSLENEDEKPSKTLEDLKLEQQNKRWAWKEKDMKDIQNYIKSYDDIVPEKLIAQQKSLQDLEDELDVVESLIDNKETDILVQIREEKEREFNNFMAGVKNYMREDNKSSEESDFKKGMQSYLDLIDNNKTDNLPIKYPEMKTKTLENLKEKLFNDNQQIQNSSSSCPVKKLSPDQLKAVTSPQTAEPIKQQEVTGEIQGKTTSLVKSFFESQSETPSPMIRSKGIHPSVLNLKRSNSGASNKIISDQLQYKLKTIHEVHQYIESHENLCVPTLIEAIQKFFMTKKEDEKILNYKKFLDLSHTFLNQKARSEEQKIFKENIEAYLKVIEDKDINVNGTPKLKKHSTEVSNQITNIKKKQIEKGNDMTATETYLTPEERHKNILQKYGLKDHIRVSSMSDDTDISSDEDDDSEDLKELSDNELCLKYGLPQMNIIESESKNVSAAASAAGFKTLLNKIKQASTGKHFDNTNITQLSEKVEKEEGLPKSGSTARMKDLFECRSTDKESPCIPRKNEEKYKKGMNTKLIERFENAGSSKDSSTIPEPFKVQKSSTISNIGTLLEQSKAINEDIMHGSPNIQQKRSFTVDRSSSFSKFKNAFETGIGINSNDDEEEVFDQGGVKAELDALKTSSKVQSMFRINRSRSDAECSPKVERRLDEKTLQEVSRSKSAIAEMFESQTPKITYGGSAKKKEVEKPKPKLPAKPKSDDNRKWVFDTIQKYFDVIVEEEQEEEDEEANDKGYSDNEENDEESDYTSAEEELHDQPEQFTPKAVVKNQIDISSFFQSKTPSPITPKTDYPKRRISLNDFVEDAAKQFDELTDGSDLSLNDKQDSCQSLNQLSKSNSSSKIRGLFSSVVHGSANEINISTFKSNLLRHLSNKKVHFRTETSNFDPGVGDETSSEFSEYDD